MAIYCPGCKEKILNPNSNLVRHVDGLLIVQRQVNFNRSAVTRSNRFGSLLRIRL